MSKFENLKFLMLRLKLYVKSYDLKTYQDLHAFLHETFMNAPYGSRIKNNIALLSSVVTCDREFGVECFNKRVKDLRWILMHP